MSGASSPRDRGRVAFEAICASLVAALLLGFGWMSLIAGGSTLSGGRFRPVPAWVSGPEGAMLAAAAFCAAYAMVVWVGRRLRWPALLHVMATLFLFAPPLLYAALYGM